MAALDDIHTLEGRHNLDRRLLQKMLQSRSEAAGLRKNYDTRLVQEP